MAEINLKLLLEPIAHKWRVQSFSKFRALATCVPYVDARDVMGRLDKVVGPLNWKDDYKEVGGRTLCGISIFSGREWVTKWDTGTKTKIEGDKGLVSDSFKRAAVKWGVGRFLYSVDTQFVPANSKKDSDKNKYPHVVDASGKKVYDLTEYINSILEERQPVGEEDKKWAPYWYGIIDSECNDSFDLTPWWNKNTGDIGRYLDEAELNKVISYLSQLKQAFFEKEEVQCPKDDSGQLMVRRIDCESSLCRRDCPVLPEIKADK